MSATVWRRQRAWLAAPLLAACVGEAAPAARTVHAELRALAFAPDSLRVAIGDTIIWTNHDLVPHTITAEGAGPASPTVPAGGSYTWVVGTKGSVRLTCQFHPAMRAVVDAR